MRRAGVVLFLSAVLALSACSTPVAETEMRWAKDGASQSELDADLATCRQQAAGTSAESKRFDHIAKGSAFMGCMTERGWRQVAADS